MTLCVIVKDESLSCEFAEDQNITQLSSPFVNNAKSSKQLTNFTVSLYFHCEPWLLVRVSLSSADSITKFN